jgi:hypothetical protein
MARFSSLNALTVNDVARIQGWADNSIEIRPRWTLSSITGTTPSSGGILLSYFTPVVNMTVSQISSASFGTTASGLTEARLGLYQFVSPSSATLLARTANDPTLFTTAFTIYTRNFDTTGGYPSSVTLTAGTVYAIAQIAVGDVMGGRPTYASQNNPFTVQPLAGGSRTGQSTLPQNLTSISSSSVVTWGRLS